MSNFSDKRFNLSSMEKTAHLNTSKRSEFFSDKNTGFEKSYLANKTNQGALNGMLLPHQSSVASQVHQFFKVPNFDSLPVKKAVRSIKSPMKKVQTGRVKNDLKSTQSSKMSLIPRPSFINSRKSIHGSRINQFNARKELIKKMVYLAQCTLKENREVKQTTPVKALAGLTPKKTPRSGGYFILPEFNKKLPKLEDIRSPLQDFIKKEMFSYSEKKAIVKKINEISPVKPNEDENFSFIVEPKKKPNTENRKFPERNTRYLSILSHCKTYNTEVNVIHGKLKCLDETFEKKLENLPDYRVYNEFCFYQLQKENIYKELQRLETELKDFITTHVKVGGRLEACMRKKRELFEKQIKLHKDFEQAVSDAMEKSEKNEREEAKDETKLVEKVKTETPKLRRSLRLSKIKKSKFEERTPMTRKLKKLDSKSKGIQKSGKVRSP